MVNVGCSLTPAYNFILKYEAYLKAHKLIDHHKTIGTNTVMKHIERFCKMITLAYKLDWIEKDPFINFNSKFEKVERNFLSESELLAIENKHFQLKDFALLEICLCVLATLD